MNENKQIVLSDFPVVTCSSVNMLLPENRFMHFWGPPYYKPILTEAREGKLGIIFMTTEKQDQQFFPESNRGLYQTGVVCNVVKVDSQSPHVELYGMYRAKAGEYVKNPRGYWVASLVECIVDKDEKPFVKNENGDTVVDPKYQNTLDGMFSNIKKRFLRLYQECDKLSDPEDPEDNDLLVMTDLYESFDSYDLSKRDSIDILIWQIVYAMPSINPSQKQYFIEQVSLVHRIDYCLKLLEDNIRILKSSNESHVIGDGDDSEKDKIAGSDPKIGEMWKRYEKIKDTITPEAQKAVLEDFNRLSGSRPGESERNIFFNHLDSLLNLYSTVRTRQVQDISKVEQVLGRSHHGLEDIKDIIYDHLATRIRNPRGKAPILCFVGPPGVGKTSIGKSIAESLGLKFIRLSLGGLRDQADIRGHRLTYIGAIPGKIIQEITRTGDRNPVFMLDEIDKVGNDFRGDPSSALLEVLDPEQNYSFRDHYIGAPFDLSEVLFLCTANLESSIQPALLDRMEIIRISGYTEDEKVQIAKQFLIPEQIVETGLPDVTFSWENDNPDKIISSIVSGYTREAGVRELKRKIHQMFSRWGRQFMKKGGKKSSNAMITGKLVEELLGLPKHNHERANETEIGEAIGLAWTPVGGDILYIQAQLTPHGRAGKDISQTGGLMNVFKEANHNALTVAKNLLKDNEKAMELLKDNLLHLSVPDGGVKKDGPSAGVAMTIAICSELTSSVLRPFVAVSGEITIKGRIRAVGGIKEKVLAAHRDGIREIILPVSNKRDVDEDISKEIKEDITFHFVTRIKDVLRIVFPKGHTFNA